MDEGALTTAVADDLITYVLEGDLPADDIAELVKPPDYPDRYADFDRLVDLHFIIQSRVDEFVKELPDRLRAIKTETEQETSVQRGGLNGRVDWTATYQERATSSPGNSGLYVTETQQEAYAIPENIVLQALLDRIEDALENIDRYLDANRTWVENTWVGTQRRRETFQTTLERNVHLRRIPDPGPDEPTDRMVARTTASRKELYRTAADLLDRRRRYDRGDQDALEDLLEDTLITPTKPQTLFELFALFRVIDALRSVGAPAVGTPTYHTIMSGRSAVAIFDGTREIQVYYNQTPDGISFTPPIDDPKSRTDLAKKRSTEVSDTFFTETNVQGPQTKRPDVVVTAEAQDVTARDYLLIEVKDSVLEDRIRSGIRELLEYLQYLKRSSETDHEFAFDEFGSGLNGVLIVQDLDDADIKPATLATQSAAELPIRIVQAQYVEDVLPSLVYRIFC